MVTNLAGWWSGITLNNYRMKRIHRWDPGSGAGKIMALAAYGEANVNIENLIKDTMILGSSKKYTDKYSPAFNFDEDLSNTKSKRSQNVAASLQSITEKELLKIYDDGYKLFPNDNLCLAGGIALNCVANTRVKSKFKNIHVPPFPNDTGLAVGMGLYHWYNILNNKKKIKSFSPYLGMIVKDSSSSIANMKEYGVLFKGVVKSRFNLGIGVGFRNYFDRCSRVLPPFSDNLDIFHIQWPKALITYTEYIEHLKIPIVLSLRGTQINASPLANKLLAKSYRKYFPKVTKFHAVSNAIVKEAEKYGVDSEKVSIINPSVDEKLLEYPKHERNDEVFKIISVGRCHWIKGYTFALDAMVQLRNKGVNFHYSIIAGGRDSENIIYQINDLGLQKNVSFINGLTHDEALKKMYSSDIYLLPSVGEGISNTVLESMALGVPVISTDCGGMGEVIKNGENGFLVPVLNVDSMVSTIRKFIDLDKKCKINIINNARKTINHNHLLSHQIDQFRIFYSKIYKDYE